MLPYILKRVLAMIPTLIGITFITFMIISLAPGDPVASSMGADSGPAGEGGGSEGSRSQADAIKAKKKLLGILREDLAVQVWDAASAAAAEKYEGDKYRDYEYFPREGGMAELGAWPYSIAPSPDGSTLYVGTEKGVVAALDTEEGALGRELGTMNSEVWSLTVSSDGALVAAGDADGLIRVWSADAQVAETQLKLPVADLVFVNDGNGLLSACDDGVIRLLTLPGLEVEREFVGHIAQVRTLALAPDGRTFYSGGYDQKLREWRLDRPEPVREVHRHGQEITDIVLTADGGRAFTGCADRKIRLLDLSPDADDALLETLEGHSLSVTALALSPDEATLYSGSADKTIRAWNLAEKRMAAASENDAGEIRDLVVSPDGSLLWSSSDSWEPVPLYKQYLNWAGKIVRLDFDRSFIDDEPVIDKIKKALPITLGLNVIAILIIYLVSIPQGVLAAVKRGGYYDNISSLILFLLWSIPSFWLATMLIIWFSSEQNPSTHILPSVGLHMDGHEKLTYLDWLWDSFKHLVLPVSALTYGGFASLSRYARTSMLETISQDFIRTARAKGLSENVVIFKHALRNSLITIITLLGNLLPAMIGGSIIIEMIFTIDGMGLLAFNGILTRDYPVIMATTTMSAFLTLLGILVSDLLYGVADPRISHG